MNLSRLAGRLPPKAHTGFVRAPDVPGCADAMPPPPFRRQRQPGATPSRAARSAAPFSSDIIPIRPRVQSKDRRTARSLAFAFALPEGARTI